MASCVGNINNFCYVCGDFTPIDSSKKSPEKKSRLISEELKEAYELYYDPHKIIENASWAPNSVCKTCYTGLLKWKKGQQQKMRYGVPMIWTDPGAHNPENCYVCANTVPGMTTIKSKSHDYAGRPSAKRPLLHSEEIPVPTLPILPSPDIVTATTSQQEETPDYSYFDPGQGTSNEPILLTQDRLDFIVSKLLLSQRGSELLARLLNENHLLARETRITAYRGRQKNLQECFMTDFDKTYAYCHNVEKLMEVMGIVYRAEEWRLFIDASKNSLKAVLLHKTNEKPAVPIAYNTETEETYEKIQTILLLVDYDRHNWRICCDLKMVAILQGLQQRYVKHMCYLCNWDTRFTGNQYKTYSWTDRGDNVIGHLNIINAALVPRENILLPYLHTKLGMVKNLLKAVIKNKKDPVHGKRVLKLLRYDIFNKKISELKLLEGEKLFVFLLLRLSSHITCLSNTNNLF